MILCKNCSPRKECFYYQNGETRTECKFYKQMTEQEYIQTCTTEQLEDVLWEKINGAFNSGYACCNLKQDKDYVGRYKRFKEWLKQPHTPFS